MFFEVFHQLEQSLISFDERYFASDYYAKFGLGPHLIQQCEEVSGEAIDEFRAEYQGKGPENVGVPIFEKEES